MTPLLAEKPPEPVEKLPLPPSHVAEPLSGRSAGASQTLRLQLGQASDNRETDEPLRDSTDDPLRIELDREHDSKHESRFRPSFEALANIQLTHSSADWLEAATVLKSDALRLRNSHLARHADLLLAIADALTFTGPQDALINEQSFSVLRQGLSLLSEPFVGEPAEEEFLINLLKTGWHLAPTVGPQVLAE
jgi:hypothetical protein